MAQVIVIEQGDKDLHNVTKVTPDTKVNQKASIKYPATDLNDGMVKTTFVEGDYTFTNPHPIGEGSDESES